MTDAAGIRIQAGALQAFCQQVLEKLDVPEEDASIAPLGKLEGIPLPPAVVAELQTPASEFGIDLDLSTEPAGT